eukprot:CAMPEP_0119013220 /NCGR_PEP_ID=MMETSP1176-20130426/8187_1 /TAXON_ID=265551 /ORGANISM="Synedropsis recta cf, Strain CCMP1620" /LENGTH=348 /DNA_ID=CAMNT_0006966289 /DNA_START=119 /DNA_END=1165 /DNA_ORIENTATION=-
MISLTHFCAGVSAAIVVKLTSSIDDVIWLSAFLTPSAPKRGSNALTYAAVCLLQTCLAYIIATFGQVATDAIMGGGNDDDDLDDLDDGDNNNNNKHMSSERLLTLVAGAALFIYAIVLGIEYYNELYDDDDEDADYAEVRLTSSTDDSCDTTNHNTDGRRSIDDCDDVVDVEEEEPTVPPMKQITIQDEESSFHAQSPPAAAPHDDDDDDVEMTAGMSVSSMVPMEIDYDGPLAVLDDEPCNDDTCTTSKPPRTLASSSDKQSRSLAVIAFLGSLDDLTLFVPMLVGKAFGIVELILGAMIATLAIIVICLCLTQCQFVANVLEKIPLVAIVSVFCIVLLTKGIFLMV